MTTRYNKPVSRTVSTVGGDLVVTLTDKGIGIRAYGKRRTLTTTYEDIATLALKRHQIALTAEQWEQPLKSLKHILPQRP